MHKYQSLHVAVLAGLVAAVTFLIFQSRALTFRLEALKAECASHAPAISVAEAQKARPADPPIQLEMSPPADPAPPSPVRPLEGKPTMENAATPRAGNAAELTSAQEEAVARSVDRILKEKYGHLPKMANPEDLEKTLEKELNLTASQKARISILLDQKRAEMHEVFTGDNPLSGTNLKKGMEIENKYDAAIKRELDTTQAAKYEQLKKDGRIGQGIMVQIETKDQE